MTFARILLLLCVPLLAGADEVKVLFREDFREVPAHFPATSADLTSDFLTLKQLGPGAGRLKLSYHPEVRNDPHYLWNGECRGPILISFPFKKISDLSLEGMRLTLRTKNVGAAKLYLSVLSEGKWYARTTPVANQEDWNVQSFLLAESEWVSLDPDKVTLVNNKVTPVLSKVDGIGFAAPIQSRRTEDCIRLDWFAVTIGAIPDELEKPAEKSIPKKGGSKNNRPKDKLPKDDLSENGFLEPQTPFLRSALVFPSAGKSHHVRRGIIVPLDHIGTWGCFDPDILDWAVFWKTAPNQAPLSYDTMASISYPNERAKAVRAPMLKGEIIAINTESVARKIAGELMEGTRNDLIMPREKVGPPPAKIGRFTGISLRGKDVVIEYRLADTNISELVKRHEDGSWERLIEVGSGKSTLTFAQLIPGGKVAGLGAAQSPNEITVTPANETRVVQVSSAEKRPKVAFPEPMPATPAFPQSFTTRQRELGNQGPFAIRNIALPNSPRSIRTADMAFRADGIAMVVTLDGDVWQVSDIEGDAPSWLRVASGIFEPMAIEVDRHGRVYTMGRDQITELIDRNGDGHIDIFKNASDIFQQTLHTRDYATSLAIAQDGAFYVAKGGIHDPTEKDNELSAHRGTVLKISPDGDSVRVLADGLRLPFVGLNDAGRVFASDQQGHFVPSTPLHLISDNVPFLGFEPTNFRKSKEVTEPLLWYPYQANRSGAGFATLSEDAFPDTPNAFLQVSWNGRLFAVETPANKRAFSWQLPIQFDFPSLNGATHPISKKFYAVGLGISAYKATTKNLMGIAAVEQAISFPAPKSLEVTDNRIVISFQRPLKDGETVLPAPEGLRLFNLKRTRNYGSGHFLWDGKPGEYRLQPLSFTLAADKASLALAFEMLRKSDVFDLTLQVSSGTQTFPLHLYTFLKELPEASSQDLQRLQEEAPKIAVKPGNAQRGKLHFTNYACSGCHSLGGEKLVGPPLNGIAERREEAFIRESILAPNAVITQGFEAAMPSFEGVIPEQELADLLSYLGTLK